MNRLQTLPRFSIDYRAADFLAAVPAVFHAMPPSSVALDSILGDKPRFWASSGRMALWLILRALGLKPGAGVAVPLYCDISVAQAVRKAGYTPVFVDVVEATLTMAPESLMQKRSQISAVVVPHFFGHVANMTEIMEVAGSIPVIEDTVHSPLSFLNDRRTGDFGVACFYSFGSTKPVPAGGGGLGATNDPVLTQRVSSLAKKLTLPSFKDKCRNLVEQAAKAACFRRPFYGLFGRAIRSRAEKYRFLEPHFSQKTIQPNQAVIVLRQLARLKECVERQRHNSHRLISLLSGVENVVLPKEPPGARYNRHMFPILLADSREKNAVVLGMLKQNVDTSQVYWNLLKEAYPLGYQKGCPVSESVSGRMLTLPNHSQLSDEEIDYVAEAFIETLRAYRSTEFIQPTRIWRGEKKIPAVAR